MNITVRKMEVGILKLSTKKQAEIEDAPMSGDGPRPLPLGATEEVTSLCEGMEINEDTVDDWVSKLVQELQMNLGKELMFARVVFGDGSSVSLHPGGIIDGPLIDRASVMARSWFATTIMLTQGTQVESEERGEVAADGD